MKQASIIYRRRSSGSMLILVSITIFLIIAVFMLCFTLHNLLFQCGRCQQNSDSLVINLASGLNFNDRVSQINELEARSRELIFDSRRQLNACPSADLAFLAPLSDKFLLEAREGHVLIEQERKNQVREICRELCEEAERQNKTALERSPWNFAGVSAEQSIIERIELGRIKNVESNVPGIQVLEELAEHDKQQGFLQRGSNLLKGGINAKLPGEDGDIDFLISGLPACINGVTCAARNANPDVFVPFGTVFEKGKKYPFTFAHLPNAIRISSVVATDIGGKHQSSVKIYSVGASSGATCAID